MKDDTTELIDELGLSTRTHNCLVRAGITTVEELLKFSDDDLMQIRNIGKKCMQEIKEKLVDFA